MSFTVEDFHDLIELLAQHPEWRAELRRHVLSDDLIELPALVRQLVEAQALSTSRLDRLEATVQALVEAQARAETRLERAEARLEGVEARLERVEVRLEHVETRLEGVESRLGNVETQLAGLTDRVGGLDGKMLQAEYARNGPSYFGPLARRLRVIESGPLAEMLDDAVDEGQLTEEERESIRLADLVLIGRRRSDGQDVYLVVEVSVGAGPHDVKRAIERAALVAKLGRPALAVVAGEQVLRQAGELAREQGVWAFERGHMTAPRGA